MKNPSESLLAKLKNISKSMNIPMETAMRRYAYDRLLQLISESSQKDSLCLKGGILLSAIFDGDMARPTEDLDFNGMKPGLSIEDFQNTLIEICKRHGDADGLSFDVDNIKILRDRDGIVPGGKLMMPAQIGKSKIRMLIDVGYGNTITPRTYQMEIPTLLPKLVSPPVMTVYPAETTIAEKMHAMVRHGAFNTRIKDYYDIWRLSSHFSFEGDDLTEALQNTFSQHGDKIPDEFDALSEIYTDSPQNNKQWKDFTSMAGHGNELSFKQAVSLVREFMDPVVTAARGGASAGLWEPEQGWQAHFSPSM